MFVHHAPGVGHVFVLEHEHVGAHDHLQGLVLVVVIPARVILYDLEQLRKLGGIRLHSSRPPLVDVLEEILTAARRFSRHVTGAVNSHAGCSREPLKPPGTTDSVDAVAKDSAPSVITGSTVASAGLASACAALVTSKFGVAGTILGAALTTMIITGGAALLKSYMETLTGYVRRAPGKMRETRESRKARRYAEPDEPSGASGIGPTSGTILPAACAPPSTGSGACRKRTGVRSS